MIYPHENNHYAVPQVLLVMCNENHTYTLQKNLLSATKPHSLSQMDVNCTNMISI
jgi:hypothetical protein